MEVGAGGGGVPLEGGGGESKPKEREEREGLRDMVLFLGHPGPCGQLLEGVV